MENCINYQERIGAFLDDQLADRERLELMEHMANCPACRSVFEDHLTIHEALTELEAKAPADFHQSVMARVHETKQDRKKAAAFPRWKSWAAMAACCAVVILGVVTLGGNREVNMVNSQVSYSAGIAQTADDTAETFVYDMNKATTTADAPEAPASDDTKTDQCCLPVAEPDAQAYAVGGTEKARDDEDGCTLPGAAELNPALMVNGQIYTWASMAFDGPPQSFTPVSALRHIEGDTLTEDGQFIALFGAEGEIYADPNAPDAVYVRITTDWLENEFVRFTLAE